MGDRDRLTKKYMRNPEKYADFFNGFIYSGKDVIDWQSLEEVDPNSIIDIPIVNSKKSFTCQKIRDIIKSAIIMKDDEKFLVLLGIENQTDVHYAMPVRTMLYNAITYNEQVEMIAKNNGSGNSPDAATFLSGFSKEDRLKPVVTVTIYWGTDSWDGPTSLKEMMVPMDAETASYVDDCNINLFSIIDLDVVPDFKTRLKELFLLLNKRNNGSNLKNTILGNAEFSQIDKETARLMTEFTSLTMPRKSKGGGYNMCKAVEELKTEYKAEGHEEGFEEGREEGRVEGRQEATINILVGLVKDGLLDIDEAAKRSGLSLLDFKALFK